MKIGRAHVLKEKIAAEDGEDKGETNGITSGGLACRSFFDGGRL